MNTDRFKFRVWSKTKKQYVSFCWYGRFHNSQLEVENDSDNDEDMPIIEQCTGLKDKNGRLIYEGDIVNFYPAETKDHEKRIVVWEKDHWTTCKKSSWGANIYWCFGKHKMEIVGNIHESEVKE